MLEPVGMPLRIERERPGWTRFTDRMEPATDALRARPTRSNHPAEEKPMSLGPPYCAPRVDAPRAGAASLAPRRRLTRLAPLAVGLLLPLAAPGLTGVALADDGSSVRRVVRVVPPDAEVVDGPRVVRRTLYRPLRTVRGRAVRVGPGNRPELSIGVVRAIRADGSKSIGVVRPIRSLPACGCPVDAYGVAGHGLWCRHRGGFRSTPTPPVQPGGLVASGGGSAGAGADAPPPTSTERALVPGIASGGLGAASLQIYAGRPRPVIDGADPWDLLNDGRYRAAAERFDADGNDAQRTGAALAAALSGDLSAATSVMPAEPVLPAGVTLDETTTLRLGQVRDVFFDDDAAMRDALDTLLE